MVPDRRGNLVLSGKRHLFKLDPARPIAEGQLEQLCTSGTHGIIVGGTDGITYENTKFLYERLRRYDKPIYQEISHADAILSGFDGYLIPLVLNAGNPQWIFQVHQQAIKQFGNMIDWSKCQVEGYIILNERSKVASITEAKTSLSYEDILAYARLADQMLKLPYIYIEYSGRYGDPLLLRKLKHAIRNASLIYGGGINSEAKAREMSRYAETIIVGNVIYENFELALTTICDDFIC